jgi:hypothetical protein
MSTLTLLYILCGTVPGVVGGAGVVSYLLWRAGYELLVWGLVPFAASLLLVGTLGALLGRAAGGGRGGG